MLLQNANKRSIILLPDRTYNDETLIDVGGRVHMDENERRTQDKNMDYRVSTSDYVELIIEMVGKIENRDILKKIYTVVKTYCELMEE